MPRSFFLAEDYTFSRGSTPNSRNIVRGDTARKMRYNHLGDEGGDGPVLACFNSLYKVTYHASALCGWSRDMLPLRGPRSIAGCFVFGVAWCNVLPKLQDVNLGCGWWQYLLTAKRGLEFIFVQKYCRCGFYWVAAQAGVWGVVLWTASCKHPSEP